MERKIRLNRKINKQKPVLRLGRIILTAIFIILVAATVFNAAQPEDNTAINEKFIIPAQVKCYDYFESRLNWLLNHNMTSKQIPKGKTFYEILASENISARDIMEMEKTVRPFFDLSKTKEGQKINFWTNKENQKVEKISLFLPSEKILYITKNGHNYFPSIISTGKISIPTVYNGKISSSFYQSAIDINMPVDITMRISDIFAWDIDFLVDIRPDDTFQTIADAYYGKGEYIGHGDVLAVRFVNNKKTYESFYFTDSKGRSDYYGKDGKSTKKAFLKSPLRYRRISSYFSLRRFHPILKIYRPHYGVDYAAPTGTPVEALGDGRVLFSGWKGGYGRYIRLKHNHIYETGYGHLSRFAKGIKKGARVRQGDVIGYVGSTGLATGPHLDFSVSKRGKYIDPLKIISPPALTLSKDDKNKLNNLIHRTEKVWRKNQV